MAAKKKNTEGLAFIIDSLRKDRRAAYADIRAAAEKRGLAVWPIMFGRAQALLGIVKQKKRAAGKAVVLKPARRAPGRPPKAGRDPGRPRAAASGLEGLVGMIRSATKQQEAMRAAIWKIQGVIVSTLD
jgi:hypothetical protein